MLEHGGLAAWHRDRKRLAGSRLELDDVGAVALRAVDRDLVLCHWRRSAVSPLNHNAARGAGKVNKAVLR
jgi:hypothetical protein